MRFKIVSARSAVLFALLMVTAGAWAGTAGILDNPLKRDGLPQWTDPPETAFKLKAGGQIDLETSTVSFAGHATHLGQFTATGTYDPVTSVLHGTMELGGNDGSVSFTITFQPQPSGEAPAELHFHGLPGSNHLFNATGHGAGTLTLDEDFMFALEIEGTYRKCVPDITRSCV